MACRRLSTLTTISGIRLLLIAMASVPIQAAEITGKVRELRLNQLQYIGTHNSYHIANGDLLNTLMIRTDYRKGEKFDARRLVAALDYTHLPITTQLQLGIRKFSLDVYRDPEGGRFASPGGLKALRAQQDLPGIYMRYDPEGKMKTAGMKVMHTPDTDFYSNCLTLKDCLTEMRIWSNQHPNHFPVIVNIEAKDQTKPAIANAYTPVETLSFSSATAWTELEKEISSVLPHDKLITPDAIRGKYKTLREAILQGGWPRLAEIAGKFLFILDQYHQANLAYLGPTPTLEGRLMFTPVRPGHPAAAFVLVREDAITRFVRKGFMLSTGTDKHGIESRNLLTRKRDQAMKGGAHLLSTDYPIPDQRYSHYQVRFTAGPHPYVRCNPVTTQTPCPF